MEPVGLEPTLGFLPLIKSQVSAIQFEYDSNVGGSPRSRIPSERLRAAYAAVNTCDPCGGRGESQTHGLALIRRRLHTNPAATRQHNLVAAVRFELTTVRL